MCVWRGWGRGMGRMEIMRDFGKLGWFSWALDVRVGFQLVRT